MGTRHLTAVVLNGEYKVAQYGQWDGYLSGQGKTIAEFIANELDIKAFKQAVANCEFVSNEEVQKLWESVGADETGFVTMDISEKFREKFPALSRDTGAGVLSVIQSQNGANLTNSISFAGESLFCEFAYVLDLDNEILEIYTGYNTQPLAADERFAGPEFKTDEEYYPVRLLTAIGFDEVTPELILELDESMNEAEE